MKPGGSAVDSRGIEVYILRKIYSFAEEVL